MNMNNTENHLSLPPVNKSQVEDFDLVILGGGSGSTIAEWTFVGEGKRVAVVERK
jgi:glycerol-3-phosphate dehydrogenase